MLELIHDFVVFDAGTKKVCRQNQYFGVKAAQDALREREGGIIWHTQGSGKSLTMVWLAKWIRENNPAARVYNNLGANEALAVAINHAIVEKAQDDWWNHSGKTRVVRNAILAILGEESLTDKILELAKLQNDYSTIL